MKRLEHPGSIPPAAPEQTVLGAADGLAAWRSWGGRRGSRLWRGARRPWHGVALERGVAEAGSSAGWCGPGTGWRWRGTTLGQSLGDTTATDDRLWLCALGK
jgi:hypothetical protein